MRLCIDGHRGAVKTLAYDATSQTLLSGGEDGIVRKLLAPRPKPPGASQPTEFAAPDPDADIQANLAPVEEISLRTISMKRDTRISDEDLQKLTGQHELRSLSLAHCKLSIIAVKELSGLQGLYSLNLSGIDLSGFDFQALKESSNISYLLLDSCGISDQQLLTIIELFPKLRELNVSNSKITDASLSRINALEKLQILRCVGTNVADGSMAAIGDLTNLEILDLSNTQLSGSDLFKLNTLRLLKELRLRGISLPDACLSAYEPGPQMKLLDVRESDVTAGGVKKFIKNARNVDLYISPGLFGPSSETQTLLELGPMRGTVEIDDKSLEILQAIDAIEGGGSITGLTWPINNIRSTEDIELLAKLPMLKRIIVARDAIPATHFPLLPKISSLRELVLTTAPYFGKSYFEPIGTIEQLESLTRNNLRVDELQQLQKLKNLRSIKYEYGVNIDELSVAIPHLQNVSCSKMTANELAKAVPYLESLETFTLPDAPDKDLVPILVQLKSLRKINLTGYISDSDLKKLRAALPNVKIAQVKK